MNITACNAHDHIIGIDVFICHKLSRLFVLVCCMCANMFKLIQGFVVAPAIFSYLQSNATLKCDIYGVRVNRKYVMSAPCTGTV